ncbi:MAG: ABC transporter substrate-binding protein [Actinomycetota bacterium]|nr:ABC transporter substrate-binding protein [Actinomycetota bacterium]
MLSAVALVAVLVAAPTVASAASHHLASPRARYSGTVAMAEAPDYPPTYIFPLISSVNSSAGNINQFQFLMYRPLYWFGDNNQPTVDYNMSIGQPPVFSNGGKTATIKLNHYTWSDGETVSSRDVVFWMNLMKAEKTEFYGYVPGYFPDNVVSVTAPSPSTVVFTFNKAYSSRWLIYNELSTVTPLPMAWDRTSLSQPVPSPTAKNLPDTTTAGAKAVYGFLNGLASKQSTWVGSPIWSVVDGPFTLSAFTNTGEATFVPNTRYTGPDRSHIAKFIELPFTSDTSEFNTLRSGKTITVGYIPPQDTPEAGAVRAEGYRSTGGYALSFGYFPINFDNPVIGPVFRQLYFRQALQHLVDQTGWVKAFYDGNATPTYGPVPFQPASSLVSPQEKVNLYPYSIAEAAKLLSEHGWKVQSGGLTTCERPGNGASECGAGIKKGLGISFNIDYASGIAPMQASMNDLQASAARVGIKIDLTSHPYASVVSSAGPCTPKESGCKWTAEYWGGGWTYLPDYLPTGEELFQTGAAANYGSYSNPLADKLIAATTTNSSQQALDAYQNYMAQQLPVIYTPEFAGSPMQGFPAVVADNLGGYATNAYQGILPEDWYVK